jgi:hypothetical protein
MKPTTFILLIFLLTSCAVRSRPWSARDKIAGAVSVAVVVVGPQQRALDEQS